MSETGICDCCYNMNKQLMKKTEFLYRAKGYLKDAKKRKHTKCAKVLERIIKDEKEHVRMLKEVCDTC